MFIINPYRFGTTPAVSYFLDTYPGARYAFSLRRLSSTYTGPVVRLRESAFNAAGDVAFSLVTNKIELTSTVTITNAGTGSGWSIGQTMPLSTFVGSNNAFVATWYDQSGNANHVSQGASASQPQLISSGTFITTSGIGGTTPTVSFNGSTHFLQKTGGIINIASTTDPFGVLVVSKFNVNAQQFLISDTVNSNSRFGFIYQNNGSNTGLGFSYRSGGSISVDYIPLVTTNFGLAISQPTSTFVTNFTNIDLYYNSALISSPAGVTAPTASGSNLFFELGRSNNISLYANAFLSEAIGYQTSIVANRVAMQSNINTFYSIY